MIKVLFFIFITSLFIKADSINIGLYGLDKKVANEKTVKRLMEKFLSDIKGLENLEVSVTTYYDEKILKEDYLLNKLNLFYLTPSLYIKHFKFFNENTKDLIILKDSADNHTQYLSLVNKTSKIESYKHLNDKNVSFYTNHNLSKLWFIKRYYEETNNKNISFHIKDYANFNQHKKILDVYFNKLDLAVVPSHVWEIAKSLNPKIVQRVEIFDKSEKIFPSVVGLFNKNYNQSIIKTHKEYINNEKNKDRIKKILSLVRYQTVESIDKTTYKQAHEFYKKYENYFYE